MFKVGDKVLVKPTSQFINNPDNPTTQNWSYTVGEVYQIQPCGIYVDFKNFTNAYYDYDLMLDTKLSRLLAGVEDENRG
jgi:uncharacterized protein (DUF2147 family)